MKHKKENTIKLIESCCILNRLAISIDEMRLEDDIKGTDHIKIFADKTIPIERETSGGNIESAVDDLFNEDNPIISKIVKSNITKGYPEGLHITGVIDFITQSILDYLLDTQDLEYPDYIVDHSDYAEAFEKTGLYSWDKDPEIIYQELVNLASNVESGL